MKVKTNLFASRTNWELTRNRLAACLDALREAGADILDLTESNPTRCGFKCFTRELLAELANPKNLNYEPSPKGLLEAREAVKNYYREKGILVSAEQIFLTASTSEAYSALFRLLANPGERILVPQPSYPLFNFLADLNDITLDPYFLRYDEVWRIDTDHLARSCISETRAIILVHPNHPTGSFVKRSEFLELVKLAKQMPLAVISDEVFSDYDLGGGSGRMISAAETNEILTFTLGGISKALGLPQMKLGWIIVNGPEAFMEEAGKRLEVILDTYLSVSTPIQTALPSWFLLRSEIQQEIKTRIKENHNFLRKQLGVSPPASLLHTEGGWYAVLKLPKTKSEEEWALEFLAKDRVLVHPGYFFDFQEEAYVVLSLIPPLKIFQEGIKRILQRSA